MTAATNHHLVLSYGDHPFTSITHSPLHNSPNYFCPTTMIQPTIYTLMSSPLGPILLARNDAGLTHINFQQGNDHVIDVAARVADGWQRDDTASDDIFADTITQLTEYFAGKRTNFDLPLAPSGTDFQQKVWAELCRIPFGETITYGELAQRINQPTAARAVGAANGKNPLPVVVPCHRVIGSSGTLIGYAGGIQIKATLLSIECKDKPEMAPLLQGSLF